MKKTSQRGFRIFGEFEGDAGRPTTVRVQESSAALRGPCVWVYHDDGKLASLHLDLAGARSLARALDVFIHEASNNMLTEPIENIPEQA